MVKPADPLKITLQDLINRLGHRNLCFYNSKNSKAIINLGKPSMWEFSVYLVCKLVCKL